MRDLLEGELRKLGFVPEKYPCKKYLIYLQLLSEWNRAYNLTAITEPKQMIIDHIINSLSVLPYIKGIHCLDIGTGAGLPGVILALSQPQKKWVLLDSVQKKIRFLRHIKHEFRMENIEIVQSRIEAYRPETEFDTLVCRAFAPLKRLMDQTQHLITSSNQLLAIKGETVGDEIRELSSSNYQIKLFDLSSSDSGAKSKLVKIQKVN
tara:strand:+ start:923 stop:1543 length:621 start_codon:yes stop_codon:yes gene_type:complete